MLQGWVVIVVALGYIGLLFVIASYGDSIRARGGARARTIIYPLSLAIYCTSWTFFGSVGLASRTGYDFLTIYVGPIIMIGLASPLIAHIVRLAKAQNITSIADFIAARYGKHQAVAATVALIAIVGSIPYIALQLKAVSASLGAILTHLDVTTGSAQPVLGDIALFVALAMAAFAVLFGTRHIDATEHQDGLILAIATESLIKLVAFVTVGVFVTFIMFDGPMDLFAKAMETPRAAAALTREPVWSTLLVMTLLSTVAIVLLPRQFHVTVVENHSEGEVRRAAWLFPLYLVLINLFVIPIAVAGLIKLAPGSDGDMFVLNLPLSAGYEMLALVAFVGGLSAATAMVIVETVALAIMASNDIVVPFVLQRREAILSGRGDVGALLLTVRRIAIFVILVFAYMYYRSAGDAQLAAIGLLSFAAVAQLAPAFFGGLVWRDGTARGALAGMTAGILVWFYTLMLPSFADAGLVGKDILTLGPFGLAWLRPQHILGLDLPPLVHGVLWSLALNVIFYVTFSLARSPTAIERLQANVFVPAEGAPMTPSFRLWRSSVTIEELTATVVALSRRGAHLLGVRELRGEPPHQPRPAAGSRHPAAALRRAYSGVRHRRGVVASGAVAAAAQAHGVHQGGAQAARRRQRGDPVQPRDPADRARSCAPGHRGVRQGAAARLLEPAVRRIARPAAVAHPRRHGARRNPPSQRRAGRARAGPGGRPRARSHHALRLGRRADPRALRRARAGDRDPRQPHAGRRPRHHRDRRDAERRGGRGARARERKSRTPRATNAPGNSPASMSRWSAPRARPRRRTSPRRASSPPRATTSCSRSTPRGSTSPAWSSGRAAARTRGWSRTSMPRSKPWKRSSARCSTSRGSIPAR